MGEATTMVVAAEGGQSNFLVPNGTFLFVLLIFLIVLGVIAKFVVPPISSVLREREDMVAKTTEDNRKAAELSAAAEADSRKVLASARSEAGRIRDEARAQGREVLEEHRDRANDEASAALAEANDELRRQGETAKADLRGSIDSLSATLADRVLGVGSTSAGITAKGR